MGGTPPPYRVTSLDTGLRLMALVRDGGAIRASDAAEELRISRSSAHRLLRALVGHGIVGQRDDKSYVAGREMKRSSDGEVRDYGPLAAAARPAMVDLANRLRLSTNLLVDQGEDVAFVSTVSVEGATPDRTGSRLPAHLTAGGRALLASLPEVEVWQRYPECASDTPPAAFSGLIRTVERARRNGYATAIAEIDAGSGALGVALRSSSGKTVASLTASGPLSRFSGREGLSTAAALNAVARALTRQL